MGGPLVREELFGSLAKIITRLIVKYLRKIAIFDQNFVF